MRTEVKAASAGSDPSAGSGAGAALLTRAEELAGYTLGELGTRIGVEVPSEGLRAKGLAGQIMERLLGATAASRAEPDFPELGIELKTIPLDASGKPQESTFVCTIALNEVAETDWEQSLVWAKLKRVLWVPIESGVRKPLHARRVGVAKLWSPSDVQRRVLRRDWETFAELIAAGAIEHITGHMGEALQIRPKGPNAAARRTAPDSDGALQYTLPRGFYLRARFTRAIFASTE